VAATRAVAELGPIAGPPAAALIVAGGILAGTTVLAQGIAEGAALGQQGSQAPTTNNFTLVVDGLPRRNAVRQRGPAGQR